MAAKRHSVKHSELGPGCSCSCGFSVPPIDDRGRPLNLRLAVVVPYVTDQNEPSTVQRELVRMPQSKRYQNAQLRELWLAHFWRDDGHTDENDDPGPWRILRQTPNETQYADLSVTRGESGEWLLVTFVEVPHG